MLQIWLMLFVSILWLAASWRLAISSTVVCRQGQIMQWIAGAATLATAIAAGALFAEDYIFYLLDQEVAFGMEHGAALAAGALALIAVAEVTIRTALTLRRDKTQVLEAMLLRSRRYRWGVWGMRLGIVAAIGVAAWVRRGDVFRYPTEPLSAVIWWFVVALSVYGISSGVLRLKRLQASRESLTKIERSIAEEKESLLERRETSDTALEVFRRKEFATVMDYILRPGISTGTIGLVGARGVGKTVLQKQILAASREKNYVAFSVSCPPQIDEHDIVTNLFDRLCHACLRKMQAELRGRVPRLAGSLEVALRQGVADRAVFPAFRWVAILVCGALLVLAGYLLPRLFAIASAELVGMGLGTATLVAVLVVLVYQALRDARKANTALQILDRIEDKERAQRLARLYSLTRKAIDILETERRIKHAMGAEVKPASWLGVNLSRSEEVSRKPLSLAGLIDEYIDYVQIGVVPAYGAVVIVVDELDRVIDPDEIREFLRRIKSLLVVPNAYYVMSIAEDVVDSFQLRSTSRKGEADSTFSELVRLAPLSCEECREFFDHSGEEIEREEAYDVISVLSGGIPRDLMRTLRRYRRHPQEAERFGATPDLAGFVRREADDALRDFLAYVRHSAAIEYKEKSRICTLFAPWGGLDSLPFIRKGVLAYVQSESDRKSMTEKPRVGSQVVEPDTAPHGSGAMLSLEILVRLEVLNHLLQMLGGDLQGSQCMSREELRQVIERYSYSPFEALEMLGLGLPGSAETGARQVAA